MTKEAGWKQFITTGKVEDYLQFKAIKEEEDSKKVIEEEKIHAGFGNGDRDRFK
ncbi:MAG: hypothetical protein ACI4DN_00525 [Lachnospiraceae bacterium]